MKADLAIYTHVLGVPGQYESVALMLSHKMDFNCCANRDGFRKSSHICSIYIFIDILHSFIDKSAFLRFQNPHNFEVGTTVRYGAPAKYGVIKWIGILPNNRKMAYAGLEMVSLSYEHQIYRAHKYMQENKFRWVQPKSVTNNNSKYE